MILFTTMLYIYLFIKTLSSHSDLYIESVTVNYRWNPDQGGRFNISLNFSKSSALSFSRFNKSSALSFSRFFAAFSSEAFIILIKSLVVNDGCSMLFDLAGETFSATSALHEDGGRQVEGRLYLVGFGSSFCRHVLRILWRWAISLLVFLPIVEGLL